MERRPTMDELGRTRAEVDALHQTALGLLEHRDPSALLDEILVRAADLANTAHAYLYLVEAAAGDLVVRAGTGLFARHIGYRLRRGEGLAGRVWDRGEAIVIDEYHAWAGGRPEFGWIGAAAGLPLRDEGAIVGVIGVVHVEPGLVFRPEEVELLKRFADLASLALESSRVYATARRANEELARANAELRAADEMKSHFVAVASHELRTPLTSMVGFASTMLSHWDAVSDDDKRQYVRVIERQALHLSRIVDDLLTMSRIEAGVVEPHAEPVLVREAVAHAMDAIGGSLDGVDVDCEDDLVVLADPDHLRQILTNFLTNAVRYGSTPIRVEGRRTKDGATLAVVDHGTGVREEFVPRLFDKFSQAPSRSEHAGGTGLGLSIVRGLARAGGGDAWYEPNRPTGARFVMSLPVPEYHGRSETTSDER